MCDLTNFSYVIVECTINHFANVVIIYQKHV